MKPLYKFFLYFWGGAGFLAVGFEIFMSDEISWSFVVAGICVSIFLIVAAFSSRK
jgi:hypothetical protein